MRHFARVLAVVAAVALISYGMIQPIENDTRWLLTLWLAAPLLLVAARLTMPQQPRGVSRSIQHLGLLVALGFVLLSIQLLRQQFVRASEIANIVHVDEQTGQTTSNVRQVIESLRVRRGKMIDRNGTVLVDTEIIDNTYAVRRYPLAQQYDPAAFSNLVGFFSDRFAIWALEASATPTHGAASATLFSRRCSLLGQRGWRRIQPDDRCTPAGRRQAAARSRHRPVVVSTRKRRGAGHGQQPRLRPGARWRLTLPPTAPLKISASRPTGARSTATTPASRC
ncbi:MAG: hypothetical protein U0Z44_13020 [Kouleothrix sp.]